MWINDPFGAVAIHSQILGFWVRGMQDGAVPWNVKGPVRSYEYGSLVYSALHYLFFLHLFFHPAPYTKPVDVRGHMHPKLLQTSHELEIHGNPLCQANPSPGRVEQL